MCVGETLRDVAIIAIFVAVGIAHRTIWKLSELHFPNVIQDFYRYC